MSFAEAVRVTIFTPPAPNVHPLQWDVVAGAKPSRIAQKPTEMMTQEIGPFGVGQLVGNSHPGRYDWLFVPQEPTSSAPPSMFPNVGAVPDALRHLLNAVKQWPALAKPVNRLAVGVVLLEPVPSLDDARKVLTPMVPSVQLPTGNSIPDFLFQVNRPRPSKTANGLMLNRLSKWQIIQTELVMFTVTPGVPAPMLPSSNKAIAMRGEIDANSVPTNGNIASQDVLPLLDELSSLALEIAQKGDVP